MLRFTSSPCYVAAVRCRTNLPQDGFIRGYHEGAIEPSFFVPCSNFQKILWYSICFFFVCHHCLPQGTAGHRVDPTSAFDLALLAGARLTAAMRLAVEQELGFTVSAGIASNKVLAKLASSINKPNKQVRVVVV